MSQEDSQKELRFSNNQYYFKNVLSIPLILNQIFKYMKYENAKCLCLCSKNTYHLFCNQIKKLICNNKIKERKIIGIVNKYKNILELNLEKCKILKIIHLYQN